MDFLNAFTLADFGYIFIISILLVKHFGFAKKEDLTSLEAEMIDKVDIRFQNIEKKLEEFDKGCHASFTQKSFCDLKHGDLDKRIDRIDLSIEKLHNKSDENYNKLDCKIQSMQLSISAQINRIYELFKEGN